MKKLLLLCALASLAACTEIQTTGETLTCGDLTFYVIKVGECEYLYSKIGSHRLFTHKGDCKNPIHAPIAMYENIPFDTTLVKGSDTTYIGK